MRKSMMQKKSRALSRIEEKMSQVEEGSLRYEILAIAKNFKSSWIELGQYLITVQREKLYKDWGYLAFDAYCVKEIGIRKETALKLLRSYYFLQEEEPDYLKKEYLESAGPEKIPSYESIYTLRKIKDNKNISISDYNRIKQQIFEEGKPEQEIKQAYHTILKSLGEDSPEEERLRKRLQYIRRMVGTLNAIKKEIQANKFLPGKIISELDGLIHKLELELSNKNFKL